jgi:beta-alanine degradation protein BauB
MMARARGVPVIDEERVRVTTWTFDAQGDDTGAHTHPYDYVVVPISGGSFLVTESSGSTRTLTQHAGVPYAGTAGTSHNVANTSHGAVTFVEVELKQSPV